MLSRVRRSSWISRKRLKNSAKRILNVIIFWQKLDEIIVNYIKSSRKCSYFYEIFYKKSII